MTMAISDSASRDGGHRVSYSKISDVKTIVNVMTRSVKGVLIASAYMHSDWTNQEHINTRFIKTQAGISYQAFARERDETFCLHNSRCSCFRGDMERTQTQLSWLIKPKLTQKQRWCRYVFANWSIRVGESKSPCAMGKDRNRKTFAGVGWFGQKDVKTNRPHASEMLFSHIDGGVFLIIALFFRRNKFNWNQLACVPKLSDEWDSECELYRSEKSKSFQNPLSLRSVSVSFVEHPQLRVERDNDRLARKAPNECLPEKNLQDSRLMVIELLIPFRTQNHSSIVAAVSVKSVQDLSVVLILIC